MIVEVLWFAGCCAVIVLGWRARKRPQVPLMRRAIVRLDLGAIRQKAAERHGWSGETAQALEDEYRDFLILIAENPGSVISPWSDALDLFWHEHILDTARYAADCKRIFGRFIQHDPHISRNPYRHESTIKRTMELREAQLLSRKERQERAASGAGGVASDGFNVATWGCASVDSGHHGPGGHSCGAGGHHGDGHSGGGGHSCGGGHGCGGHGCGGGGH